MREINYITERFREYYKSATLFFPREMEKREWGIGNREKKIAIRHLKFRSPEDLKGYLIRNTPFFISYSCAYYEFPDARPMPKKNWCGADLVFDLDADQLNLECKNIHGAKWVCDKCIERVKEETIKLIEEFLIPDFGLKRDEIEVNFSGNRGFHVHVFNKELKQLGNYARREITDYIVGSGVQYECIFMDERVGRYKRHKGPTPNMEGWYGRIAREFLSSLEKGKLEKLGISKSVAKKMYGKKEEIKEKIFKGNWDWFGIKKPKEFWQSVIISCGIKIGEKIDQGVTSDSTKLIRLPESLHGDTGLIAKRVSDLNRFDPFRDAVAFGNSPIRLNIGRAPIIRIGDEEYGPFANVNMEVPESLAILLLCKKEATLSIG